MSQAKPQARQGALRADGKRFAIVASRWNESMVDKLMDGAVEALRRAGAPDAHIEIFRCPGAFEIPAATRRVIETGRFAGVICLGVVIRGDTPHFDLVAGEASRAIADIAAEAKVAIGFGILACNTTEQALDRCGGKAGNRGIDTAEVAIEMANLFDELKGQARDK